MSWDSTEREYRRTVWLRRVRRVWDFAWRSFLTLLIPAILIAGWYAYQASQFDISQVAEMPARTVLLDREGRECGTIHGTNRRLVEGEHLSSFLKNALFAREDSRFREHNGVDPIGVARAIFRNVKDLEFTQGASTLSMQLARNTYDLREKRSLSRKFLEVALTYRIESHYTKDEILIHYLNRIYFGAGCHGLEEASLTYFGVSAHKLTQGQAALLVGIIRAPHAFSPFRDMEAALAQRDEVLDRMAILGHIDQLHADRIKTEPLRFRDPDAGFPSSGHAERALRRPLEIVLDDSQIKDGGLTVFTSIDRELQASLEATLTSLTLPGDCQCAGIALDPRNGDILAIVGCREKQPSGFNRALDMHRDLGDRLIEPLVAAAALERGHLPVPGRPVSTGRQLGEKETIRLLKRFGFEGVFGKGDDLYRGTMTVSPLELATAYATLLQGGQRPAPCFVRSVKKGDTQLFNRPPAFFPAFSGNAIPESLPSKISGYSLSKCDYWSASLAHNRIIVTWIGYDRPKRLQITDDILATLPLR
ncbi:MAG: transglycosylase domain-containing protein [Verrucomicrobiaceae bacterium]